MTPRDFAPENEITFVPEPTDEDLARAIGDIRKKLISRGLKSRVITVLGELVSNLRDHGSPPVGTVRVYEQKGRYIIEARGKATPDQKRILVQKVWSLTEGKDYAAKIPERLTRRLELERERGRGLLWIAQNTIGADGNSDLELSWTGEHGNDFIVRSIVHVPKEGQAA